MQELAAYFYNHVFQAYHRYKEIKYDPVMGQYKDKRAAIDAAIALFHFREHIPDPYKKTKAELSSLYPDYALIGDIANASKHKTLTRSNPIPRVLSVDDISEIQVSTSYQDEEGEYKHIEKIVEVKLADGRIRDVFEILTNVLNIWFDELNRIGAIDQREPIQLNNNDLISRKDACSNMGVSVTQGIQWKQKFRFQQYNYVTNEIEAVDLSDAENITFSVYEPPTYEIVLGDDSGPKISKKIKLTPEENIELKKIKDKTLRNKFLIELALKQGVAGQMVKEYLNDQNKDENI